MLKTKNCGGVFRMSHFDSLKALRNEVGVSRHVSISHLVSPTIAETKDGKLISVIHVKGHPFDTESESVLNHLRQVWHRTLVATDEDIGYFVHCYRHKISSSRAGEFNHHFLQEIDDAYSTQFENDIFQNDIFICLVLKGLNQNKASTGIGLLKKLSDHAVKSARRERRTTDIGKIRTVTVQLIESLSDFSPSLLGENDTYTGQSELIGFLGLAINGCEKVLLRSGQVIQIDKGIEDRSSATFQEKNISQYLANKQILFGKYIQFQGQVEGDTKYATILTIKSYPQHTASIITNTLLKLDCEFFSTNSFLPETKDKAQEKIKKHIVKMEAIEDPAVSQIDQLSELKDDLQSDRLKMGHHHHTMMLFSKDIMTLESSVTKAIKHYADSGIVAIRETIGLEPAFWSQFPGNFKYIARSSLITSENFVDFCPLHNYRIGFKKNNHLGDFLTLAYTPSTTPYYFNLHGQGPKDNPAPGHALMIGGNGSGKTVAMCFCDAQLSRFKGRSFFFDRNRGTEIYIRACDGYYGVLSPDFKNDIQFNPFHLDDTPDNRLFIKRWFSQLVLRDNEVELDDLSSKQVSDCVDYAFEKLAFEERNLSNAAHMLPIDFLRLNRLERWLKGTDGKPDGEYAYLFDNDTDALTFVDKMGFDMTHFLDNEPTQVLAAVSMYLFHRLESTLDGRLVSVFLDEGWQYLDNPYWNSKLRQWLPTLRKLNCHIVLATQSPKSIAQSSIAHVLLDNSASQLFFANPQAKKEDYIDGFNLTQSEFECIKNTDPMSRYFVFKQGSESCLLRFQLSGLGNLLRVFSATKMSVDFCRRLRKQFGQVSSEWLPHFLDEVNHAD